MPVNVQFSEDRRYIIYTIDDPVKIEDLLESYETEREYRNSVDYVVHSIVDMSDIKRIPPNWLTAKAGPGLTHPHSGEMVFVGISRGLRIILNTIFRITRYNKMKFFDTRAEADAYMQQLVLETPTQSAS